MPYALENFTKSAFSVFDMMLQMQRIGLEAMTMYKPLTSAYLDAVMTSQSVGLTAMSRWSIDTPGVTEAPVVAAREEMPNAEAAMLQGKSGRLRRVVVEKPVQQDVILQTEPLVQADPPPPPSTSAEVAAEVALETADVTEVPVAAEAAQAVQEALLPNETTASAETVPDAVNRDIQEIDQPAPEPVVSDASGTEGEKPQEDGHQSVAPAEPETRSGDQEWHG